MNVLWAERSVSTTIPSPIVAILTLTSVVNPAPQSIVMLASVVSRGLVSIRRFLAVMNAQQRASRFVLETRPVFAETSIATHVWTLAHRFRVGLANSARPANAFRFAPMSVRPQAKPNVRAMAFALVATTITTVASSGVQSSVVPVGPSVRQAAVSIRASMNAQMRVNSSVHPMVRAFHRAASMTVIFV